MTPYLYDVDGDGDLDLFLTLDTYTIETGTATLQKEDGTSVGGAIQGDTRLNGWIDAQGNERA